MSQRRNFPPIQQQQPNKQVVGVQTSFSGPIPHPDILKGYEMVCTGAAERIIKMAEKEQAHRHNIEIIGQKSFTNSERIGTASALVVCLITLICGFICILHGQPIPGGIAAIVPLGIIVATFVHGKKKN